MASRRAKIAGRRVSNIVFMGMGEPMANLDAVWRSVERFHGDLGLSARHITISTVGLIPGIRSLAERSLPVNLAVSLHAANDTPARRARADQQALSRSTTSSRPAATTWRSRTAGSVSNGR